MTKIIIFGSARSFGNTRKVIDRIVCGHDIPLVDLLTLDIARIIKVLTRWKNHVILSNY